MNTKITWNWYTTNITNLLYEKRHDILANIRKTMWWSSIYSYVSSKTEIYAEMYNKNFLQANATSYHDLGCIKTKM